MVVAGPAVLLDAVYSRASREPHEWISIKEAATILRTRTTNVKELVEKGILNGQFLWTESGRLMGSVQRESVTDAVLRQANLVPLTEARQISGLSKKRLYNLIGKGLLRAVRGPKIDGYPIWQFEKAALAEATKLAASQDRDRAVQKRGR